MLTNKTELNMLKNTHLIALYIYDKKKNLFFFFLNTRYHRSFKIDLQRRFRIIENNTGKIQSIQCRPSS